MEVKRNECCYCTQNPQLVAQTSHCNQSTGHSHHLVLLWIGKDCSGGGPSRNAWVAHNHGVDPVHWKQGPSYLMGHRDGPYSRSPTHCWWALEGLSDDPTHVGMGKVELECDPLGTCADPPALGTQQPPPMGKVDSARNSLSTHVGPLPLET